MSDTVTLPPLQQPGGFRGGYRVFTVETTTFEEAVALPGSFVAAENWSVSGTTPVRHPETGEFGCTLHLCYYPNGTADWETRQPHALDGTWFPNYDATRQATYEAGGLARMVYEAHRTRDDAASVGFYE